jgi:putative transposase
MKYWSEEDILFQTNDYQGTITWLDYPGYVCPVFLSTSSKGGNNRQVCFASEDFAAYAHKLEAATIKNRVAIHAWVFMTNHVHLLVTHGTRDGISRMIPTLGRRYVRYFNVTYKQTGTLWEGRFKSCVVDADNYLLTCQRYIELNPVRANRVEHPADYQWSSYRSNGMAKAARLWRPHPVYSALGETADKRASAYREIFKGHLDDELITQIRDAINQGMALGSDRFKQEIE